MGEPTDRHSTGMLFCSAGNGTLGVNPHKREFSSAKRGRTGIKYIKKSSEIKGEMIEGRNSSKIEGRITRSCRVSSTRARQLETDRQRRSSMVVLYRTDCKNDYP